MTCIGGPRSSQADLTTERPRIRQFAAARRVEAQATLPSGHALRKAGNAHQKLPVAPANACEEAEPSVVDERVLEADQDQASVVRGPSECRLVPSIVAKRRAARRPADARCEAAAHGLGAGR